MISLGDQLDLVLKRIRQLKVKSIQEIRNFKKRNIPAIIEIDNLLTNNHSDQS